MTTRPAPRRRSRSLAEPRPAAFDFDDVDFRFDDLDRAHDPTDPTGAQAADAALDPADGAGAGPETPRQGAPCESLGCQHNLRARCYRRKTLHVYRRAFSEKTLREVLGGPFEDGCSYHVISGGDVDSLSYLAVILEHQPLDYVLLSTWCMATDDVLQVREWIAAGKLDRVDFYVGEIFKASYSTEYAMLADVIRGHGRVAIFRNHAKVMAGCGPRFAFAVESSANVNTNPRTENTTITIGKDTFQFYKNFFDGIVSFNRDFDDWKPFEHRRTEGQA